jgi:dihydrofolate synthase/folylpolyglutamate synthase
MPDAILARLTALHPKVIDLSLGRIERLLEALGNPEQRIPPAIHIAGTNGKGSTVAYLRAILEAAGFSVHVYTSPHLVHFNERIRVAGTIIADAELTALLEECERVNAGEPITFFEITTAAAFLAFSRTPADFTLLETGLGGRLDATNVLRQPLLSALTPISLDHQSYLGETLGEIAREKAGILKPGTPCVVADQEPAAANVIDAESLRIGLATWAEGADWFIAKAGERLNYRSSRQSFTGLPLPALPGPHQIRNAGLAIACIERLLDRFNIPVEAIAQGLRSVEWPARLQRLTQGPLLDLLPPEWELWLDGGHNPAAGKALATHMRNWRDKPTLAIIGMLDTKDAQGFLQPLSPRVKALRAVPVPDSQHGLLPEILVAAAKAEKIPDAEVCSSVEAALHDLCAHHPTTSRILITGSLYLAGDVLRGNR